MGFFSSLTGSFKKSKELKKLQRKISPPAQNVGDLVSDFKETLSSGANQKDQALEEFLNLCESDDGVAKVMSQYNLSRSDLKNIYIKLSFSALGQYIKGHHAALSSIAYYEPLLYIVESEKRGENWNTIVGNLLHYWHGKIPQSGLINQLG